MDNQRDSLLGVFRTLYQWRKTIRNVCLVALAGSVVISLFLDNYYESTTICYPASPQLANPELLFGNTGQVTQYYGTDQDLDRIAEIANSNTLVDYMVHQFRLYEHYGIDSSSTDGPYKVRKRFRKLYTAEKDKHDALTISVEDTDPRMAASMANAARDKVDEMARALTREGQGRLLAAIEDNVRNKQADLLRLGDSLQLLQNRYGIYDPETQGEQLAGQLAIAESEVIKNRARLEVLEADPNIPRDTITFIKANLRAAEQQRRQLTTGSNLTAKDDESILTVRRFTEGLPLVSVVKDLHYQARKQLSFDLERYNQIKAVYNTSISAIHVVEPAEVPLRKSRPIRSLIVAVSVVAAFVFTLLAALIADAYRDVNWKQFLN